MKIREIFGDSRFNRRLWHLAWPIALQSLLLASVAAADALMLGLLEQNAMAAVALAAQISFVMSIFILGIASGGSVLAVLGQERSGEPGSHLSYHAANHGSGGPCLFFGLFFHPPAADDDLQL